MAKELSKAQKVMAKYLTDDYIKIIQAFIDENITASHSMTARKIYAELKDQIPVVENTFCSSMSTNVIMGKITGIVGKQGKGYVRIDSNASQASPKPKPVKTKAPEPNVEQPVKAPEVPSEAVLSPPVPETPELPKAPPPAPKPKRATARHVWIDDTLYRVPMLMGNLHKLVNQVLRGKQEEGGDIAFDGKQFIVDDKDLFKRFLDFHGALNCGTSEPVLDDGSGIPVELRM